MRRRCGQSGMSLMEMLVALAVILILISTLIGVGSFVKTRASLDLTKATIETLCTALAQYHSDFGDFPFAANVVFDEVAFETIFLPVIADVMPDGSLEETDGNSNTVFTASSAALFYFLDKNPSSRGIVEAVANSLVTNKDDSGVGITLEKPPASGIFIDLPRYIDPWGMSIRYEYLPGTAFPVLTSAGPDKIFDTPDDITSK